MRVAEFLGHLKSFDFVAGFAIGFPWGGIISLLIVMPRKRSD